MTTTLTTPCTACAGEGLHYRKTCGHLVTCPCLRDEVECERCAGTGEDPCGYCGEHAGIVETPYGRYCARCARRQNDERKAA